MNVDVQSILTAYEREIANLTRRAVIAETALEQSRLAERQSEKDKQPSEGE